MPFQRAHSGRLVPDRHREPAEQLQMPVEGWSLLLPRSRLIGTNVPAACIRSHCLYTTQNGNASHCLYMAEKRIKTAQVNLRIRPELKTAAEKAASDDH